MTPHTTGLRRALASSAVAASFAVQTALALLVGLVGLGGLAMTGTAMAGTQGMQSGAEASRPGTVAQGDANARSTPMPAMTPVPTWVTPIEPALDKSLPADASGVDFLLVDQQTRVTSNDRFNYRHRADRIRTERGLDSSGQIEVSFNPAYQSVQFHHLRIYRQGQVLPWQSHTRARWLDRETQLEKGVYDGSRTLLLTLDDLRVGDVLEYAYTVRGSNPVFGNRQFGGGDLQFSVQIAHLHGRLLMPASRAPTFQTSPGVKVQRRFLSDGEQEWQWEVKDSTALRLDSGTPSWFMPYARVSWSEFEDWGAVARWATPLYQLPLIPAAPVQQVLDELKQRHDTKEAQIAGALRLVQEQVRYLSVSIGAGSHAPRRPEQVLAQRFGDCKDKSLLTVALLRGLGVQAWVALVNTELREHLDQLQPSPGAFDHAIVLARWNGKNYWLDPTRAPQSGSLGQLVQANFGQALVVDRTTTELIAIETAPSVVDRREISASFDLRGGANEPVLYKVITRYFGAAAEAMRMEFGSGDGRLERLQKLNLGYYARSFKDIEVAEPMRWEDDPQENILTLTEHYRIRQLWRRGSGRGAPLEAPLATPEMDSMLTQPDLSQREHPLARIHPRRLDMTVQALLPSEWSPLAQQSGQMEVNDEQFSFKRSYLRDGRRLTLTQQFISLSDHVQPNQMASYLAHLKRADEWSGYLLKWGKDGDAREDVAAVAPGSGSGSGSGNGRGTGSGRTSTTAALALLGVGLIVGVLRLLRPLAVRLRLRHERHPLPASGAHAQRPMRGATGVVALALPTPGDDPLQRAQETVSGSGRDGWRTWLHLWVGTALLLLGLGMLLMWQVCRIQGDQVLLQLAHWVYGLGAIALGAWIVRSLEPWALARIGRWQWERLGDRGYRALLWRIGVTDEFPADDEAQPSLNASALSAPPPSSPAHPEWNAPQTPGHR